MRRILSKLSRPMTGALLLGALVISCGGSSHDIAAAQRFMQRGQLDEASEQLVGVETERANALREDIEQRQAARRDLERSIASLSDMDPRDVVDRLKEMLDGVSDPWSIEQIKIELSDAVDRAASLGSSERVARRDQSDRTARREAAAAHAGEDARQLGSPAVVSATSGLEAIPMQAAEELEPDITGGHSAEQSQQDSSAAASLVDHEPQASEEHDTAEVHGDSPQAARPIVTALDILRPELEAGERALTKAKASAREEAYAALDEHGELARPYLERALQARWEKATHNTVKNSGLRALEKLAQDREELDYRRKQALELIFDEEEYFYPYRPPECPPEKAKLYGAVQRRVDQLVDELREAWEVPRKVKLGDSFHDLVEELGWLRARAAEHALRLELPAELPERVLSIGPEIRSLNVRNFAWDEEEASRLRRDVAVLAYNEKLWSKARQKDLSAEQVAIGAEQEQVEITNAYRLMFGRRAVAWNPLLQEAADGHSEYMARTGKFGHYEEGDATRRSPFDRMALTGYTRGVSENVSMGATSPQGAQDGWARSSGHHRNLLMPRHTEMASAFGGSYWTQNFGNDKAFENELDSWQD